MSRPASVTPGAVIFDMDGVLCDSEEYMTAAAVQMFKDRYGVDVSPADFIPFFGMGENRYLGGVAAKYGIAWSLEEDKEYAYKKYLEIIKGKLQPLDGVREFISWCEGQEIDLAVATSADKVKMDGNLEEIGLSQNLFKGLVNGLDVVRKKPEPDIFIEAARRMQRDPSDCMVVEDSPSGIRAAKRAGCVACGITTNFAREQLAHAGADLIVNNLTELPAILESK